MPARFGDAEQRAVNLERIIAWMKSVLLERIFVDADAIGLQLLAELIDHRIVDDEVGLDGLRPVGICLTRASPSTS